MIAPRTGLGFALSVFAGVMTWVFLNPSTHGVIAISGALVVSVATDWLIRWRAARRQRRRDRRDRDAERSAEDDFWRDRR